MSLTGRILPTDMADLLLGRKEIDKERLKQRYNSLVVIDKPARRIKIIEGERAKKIVDNFLKELKVSAKSDEINGTPASSGTAVGRVRVIMNARECNKLKKGEILVTAMTSPDFMVAVRRAKAIVTDEGGLTSHAAIVSSELGLCPA